MRTARSVRTGALLVAIAAVLAWLAWNQLGAGRVRDLADLQVGDCVNVPSGDFTNAIAVPSVRCTRAHNAELYLIGRLDRPRERDYPGEDMARAESLELCRGDAFAEYVGEDVERSPHEVVVFWPSEVDWRPTRGVVYCFVRLGGEATTTARIGSAHRR